MPPSVTPWYSVTSSPISAVSPITTPIPWSMKKPVADRARPGWISIPVIDRAIAAITRGSSGTPAPYSACATRWASSAWTPGQVARISSEPTPRAAGSRLLRRGDVAADLRRVRADQPRPSIDKA